MASLSRCSDAPASHHGLPFARHSATFLTRAQPAERARDVGSALACCSREHTYGHVARHPGRRVDAARAAADAHVGPVPAAPAAVVFLLTRTTTAPGASSTPAPRPRWSARMADWFAVTALFRHPLGMPVPHTAIIPTPQGRVRAQPRGVRRRQLPAAHVIRDRLRAADVAVRLGRWLGDAATPHGWWPRRAAPAAVRAHSGRGRRPLVAEVLIPRLIEEPISAGRRPAAAGDRRGRRASRAGRPRLLEEAHRWLVDNQETFALVVGESAPLVGARAAERRGDQPAAPRGGRGSPTSASDPDHHARQALDSLLPSSRRTCRPTPRPMERLSGSRRRCSTSPQIRDGIASVERVRTALLVERWTRRTARCASACRRDGGVR